MNSLTLWVLLATAALLIGYDVYCVIKKDDSTISATLYHAAQRWPIIAFLGGLLCGHLWWPQVN